MRPSKRKSTSRRAAVKPAPAPLPPAQQGKVVRRAFRRGQRRSTSRRVGYAAAPAPRPSKHRTRARHSTSARRPPAAAATK